MTFGLLAGLVALGQVKAQKGGPKDIVMIMNAVAAFTDLDDESDEITITRTYRRHSDATLARMMWRELLKNACAQNPASS